MQHAACSKYPVPMYVLCTSHPYPLTGPYQYICHITLLPLPSHERAAYECHYCQGRGRETYRKEGTRNLGTFGRAAFAHLLDFYLGRYQMDEGMANKYYIHYLFNLKLFCGYGEVAIMYTNYFCMYEAEGLGSERECIGVIGAWACGSCGTVQ